MQRVFDNNESLRAWNQKLVNQLAEISHSPQDIGSLLGGIQNLLQQAVSYSDISIAGTHATMVTCTDKCKDDRSERFRFLR